MEPVSRTFDTAHGGRHSVGQYIDVPCAYGNHGVVGCIRHQRGVTVVEVQRHEVEVAGQGREMVGCSALGDRDAEFGHLLPVGRNDDEARTRCAVRITLRNRIDVILCLVDAQPGKRAPVVIDGFCAPLDVYGSDVDDGSRIVVVFPCDGAFGIGGEGRWKYLRFLNDYDGFRGGGGMLRRYDDFACPAPGFGVVRDGDGQLPLLLRQRYPSLCVVIGFGSPFHGFGFGGYGHLLRYGPFGRKCQRGRFDRKGDLRRFGIRLLSYRDAAGGKFAVVGRIYPDLAYPFFGQLVVRDGDGERSALLCYRKPLLRNRRNGVFPGHVVGGHCNGLGCCPDRGEREFGRRYVEGAFFLFGRLASCGEEQCSGPQYCFFHVAFFDFVRLENVLLSCVCTGVGYFSRGGATYQLTTRVPTAVLSRTLPIRRERSGVM